MILRRFSRALKEQNWAAIWIEFVLLVTGVFLCIEVADQGVALNTIEIYKPVLSDMLGRDEAGTTR